MSYLQAQPIDRKQVKVEEVVDRLNTEAVHGGFKCCQCSYETNDEKDLQKHLNTHKKPVQCDICMKNFTLKDNLKRHIKKNHKENGYAKGYQCSECIYQTNDGRDYRAHLNRHDAIKPFECGICKIKFTHKYTLNRHIKNLHAENECAKDYQCSECPFQTNYKRDYQRHLNVHSGIKQFECGICKMQFNNKRNLKTHIKNKHTENGCAKYYQCSECSFQTNYKRDYRGHLNGHSGIKPFECAICKMKFTREQNLKIHIKNKHTEDGGAKDYQCSECSFQTNYKTTYQDHVNRHRGIKPFECGICKIKFTKKAGLKMHFKNKHTEGESAKKYECSECTYQTNDRRDYQNHLNRHRGIKPFECDICKMKFTVKQSLRKHIKSKHT